MCDQVHDPQDPSELAAERRSQDGVRGQESEWLNPCATGTAPNGKSTA